MNVTFKASSGPRKPARGSGDRQRQHLADRRHSRHESSKTGARPSANNNPQKPAANHNLNQRFGYGSSPARNNRFSDSQKHLKRVASKESTKKEFLKPTVERMKHLIKIKQSEKDQRIAQWVHGQLNERIVCNEVPKAVEERRPTPVLDNCRDHYEGGHICNRHKWNVVTVPVRDAEKEVVVRKPNRAHGLHNQRIKNWDQSSTRRIGRSSSPAPHYCYHCEHDHRRDCCLQPGDSNDDISGFADWIGELETKEAKPAPFLDIPETVSGSISPPWFPKCLPVPQKKVPQQIPACSAMPPMAAHQCFVPVYGPNVRMVPLNGYQHVRTPEGFVYLVPQAPEPHHGAFNQFMRQYYHVPQVYVVQPKPCAKPCPVHSWIPGMYMQPPTYPATHLLQQLTHQYCSNQF